MKKKSSGPVLVVVIGLLAVVLVAVFLVPWPSRHHSVAPTLVLEKPSTTVDIGLYVDVSASMRNFFVNDGRTNTFAKFLSNAEFALTSGVNQGGWEQRTVRLLKFGSKSGAVQLAGNGGLRDLAANPALFDEPGTPIEAAINAEASRLPKAGTNKLLILVTDLYQSDGKLEKPAGALIRLALASPHGAIAVYGVRNPYSGPVSDVPNQNGVPLMNAATSMPFYIIIAGERAADVRRAQELLTTGGYGEPLQTALKEDRLFGVFFSKEAARVVTDPVIYDAHAIPPEKCSGIWCFSDQRARSIDAVGKSTAEPLGSRARALSARQSSFHGDADGNGIARLELGGRNSVIGLSWQKPTQVSEPMWQSVNTASHWRVQARYCAGTNTSVCDKPEIDLQAADSIHVCNVPDASGGMFCKTECPETTGCTAASSGGLALLVARSGLTARRKYLVEIDRVADAAGLGADYEEHSTLMHHWNMTPEETSALLLRREFPMDKSVGKDARPGKTPNLAQFLTAFVGSVMSTTLETERDGVVLDRHYLYLNAR